MTEFKTMETLLAPTLFSLMFSAMLTDAFNGSGVGIPIRYRTDDSVFNLRRLQARTKVSTDTINDFLLADDCALNAVSETNMQGSVDRFSDACNNFGLTISTKKTEVLYQPAPALHCSKVNAPKVVRRRGSKTRSTCSKLH